MSRSVVPKIQLSNENLVGSEEPEPFQVDEPQGNLVLGVFLVSIPFILGAALYWFFWKHGVCIVC